MSLSIASINSGSNGNCYYVGNTNEAVLIDAGVSCRETEKRMFNLGLSIKKVKAIFISHEHSDHINGLVSIVKKYKIPVYITEPTFKNSNPKVDYGLIRYYSIGEPIQIGTLLVKPFQKFHDAVDPHSYVVEFAGIKVGVFTDMGIACDQLIHHFSQCHAAFLESNYDEMLLERGNYPLHLKNRIRNGKGHLSNKQAATVVLSSKPAYMSHLLLSHLSNNNNSPTIVKSLFDSIAGDTKIIIASRYKETGVYHIKHQKVSNAIKSFAEKEFQLSLF
jgi:phosphoribosyl 1,2-cyclic phosphodiesterase